MIGHFVDAVIRHVAYRNATFPRRLQIDVVHADAITDDDPRFFHGMDNFAVSGLNCVRMALASTTARNNSATVLHWRASITASSGCRTRSSTSSGSKVWSVMRTCGMRCSRNAQE